MNLGIALRANGIAKILRRGPLLVVLVMVALGCGLDVTRPEMEYYFTHPVLNEEWKPDLWRTSSRSRVAAKLKKKSRKRKSSSKKKRRKQAARKKKQAPPAVKHHQPLRGNDVEVVRREMVLSATRLIGVKDSFDQDSFARHLLVVNNLGLGKIPGKDTLDWLYKRQGKAARVVKEVQPGDLLFLGEGGPEYVVVVEKIEGDGGVTFVGCISNEVRRGVLSLKQRQARRDERSGKVLNSFVGKSKLAGSLLMGSFSMAAHSSMLTADR